MSENKESTVSSEIEEEKITDYIVLHQIDNDPDRTNIYYRCLVSPRGTRVIYSLNKEEILSVRSMEEAETVFGAEEECSEPTKGSYIVRNDGQNRVDVGLDETPQTRVTIFISAQAVVHVHDFEFEIPTAFFS